MTWSWCIFLDLCLSLSLTALCSRVRPLPAPAGPHTCLFSHLGSDRLLAHLSLSSLLNKIAAILQAQVKCCVHLALPRQNDAWP